MLSRAFLSCDLFINKERKLDNNTDELMMNKM